jgi:hypothetical protein
VTVTPQRIQHRREKGARMTEVGLALNGLPTKLVAYQSKWRNPFPFEVYGRAECIRLFCESIAGRHAEIRRDLRGYNLTCACRLDEACHADILLRIANGDDEAPGDVAT